MSTFDLSALIVDTKNTWVEYPGIEGFEVLVAIQSRKQLNKLVKDCTVSKMDRATKRIVETVDTDKWMEKYSKAIIQDWKGLRVKDLPELMIVDISKVEDVDQEVPYSPEYARMILENSAEFDTWVNATTSDIHNFR